MSSQICFSSKIFGLLNIDEGSFYLISLVSSAYISAARRLSPSVPKELEEYIASAYSSIRQEEAKSDTPHSYTTVRTLLSILRISAVSPSLLIILLLYLY